MRTLASQVTLRGASGTSLGLTVADSVALWHSKRLSGTSLGSTEVDSDTLWHLKAHSGTSWGSTWEPWRLKSSPGAQIWYWRLRNQYRNQSQEYRATRKPATKTLETKKHEIRATRAKSRRSNLPKAA